MEYYSLNDTLHGARYGLIVKCALHTQQEVFSADRKDNAAFGE